MLASALLGVLAASSNATIFVDNLGGPVNVVPVPLGGNRVALNITPLDPTFPSLLRIRGNNPSDVIESINILDSGNASNLITLVFLDTDGSPTVIGGIEQIVLENPANTLCEISDLRISGSLGSATLANTFDIARVNNIEIGGDWNAEMTLFSPLAGTPFGINTVQIGGDWDSGFLHNRRGNIGITTVTGDITGTPANPVEIWANGNINTVQASSITDAIIGENTAGYSGNSNVINLRTTAGDFSSSTPMTMLRLTNMDIAGSFDADVTLLNAMPSTGVWDIGDSFASTAVISMPALGLDGTVQINTNDSGGQFLGDIEVGSITLAPDYEDLSNDIGDGAAGEAPYNFHQFEGPLSTGDVRNCFPHHTEQIFVGACEDVTSLDEVIIDHYGPVYVDGAGPHFRVEFKPDFSLTWTPVTNYIVDTSRTDMSDGGSNRRIYLIGDTSGLTTYDFNSAGRFRIRPMPGKVKSALGLGSSNPDVQYNSSVVSGDEGSTMGTQYDWFQFRVRLSLCQSGMATFEGEQVNTADMTAWLVEPFEVNADGFTDIQDFIDMADAYTP